MHDDNSTYLGKAIRDGQDGALWMPLDSPYLADLVNALTHHGQAHIQSFKSALAYWLSAHENPQQMPPGSPLPGMPATPIAWSEQALQAWFDYFTAKPRVLWTPEDWSMLVEWLLQKYWSPQWASSMADWLSVKATLLGQIEAGLAANPPAAALIGAMASAVPASLDAAVALGLPVSAVMRAVTAFSSERCAQLIVDMGERMRSGVRAVVLEHQQAAALGGALDNLEQRLFDRFASANRDWRRIAVTETSENAAQGVVLASQPGDRLKRIERYEGVCAWCAKINGRIMTVVDPAKKKKDGETEIWAGKTNLGRSSAPRKKVGTILVEREPDEMWWVASGAQHPNCRGRWLPVTGIDPAKLAQFVAGVKAKMAKNQADSGQ